MTKDKSPTFVGINDDLTTKWLRLSSPFYIFQFIVLCLDAVGPAPEVWSTSFEAMGCCPAMGAQKMARPTCQGHHQRPFQSGGKIRIKQ